MGGKPWKRCFSTWCAAAPSKRMQAPTETQAGHGKRHDLRKPPPERRRSRFATAERRTRFARPHRGAVQALHLSATKLRHPPGRVDLLAVPADVDLGLPAEISCRHDRPTSPSC